MKKNLSALIVMACMTLSLFAQSYSELLAKGKEYEGKKEWVYALGYYFDASHTEGADGESTERFKAIKAGFESGKIGLEDVGSSPFGTLDKWVAVRDNFLKYFTEFPCFDFYSSKPTEWSLDANKKTATYRSFMRAYGSQKFIVIKEILENALPKDLTLLKVEIDYDKYLSTNSQKINNVGELYKQMEEALQKYYKATNIALSDSVWDKVLEDKSTQGSGWYFQDSNGTCLSSLNPFITLAFVDEEGNVLYELEEQKYYVGYELKSYCNGSESKIEDVPSNVVEAIYGGKNVFIKPIKYRLSNSQFTTPHNFVKADGKINWYESKPIKRDGYDYYSLQLPYWKDGVTDFQKDVVLFEEDCFKENGKVFIKFKPWVREYAKPLYEKISKKYDYVMKNYQLAEKGFRYSTDEEINLIDSKDLATEDKKYEKSRGYPQSEIKKQSKEFKAKLAEEGYYYNFYFVKEIKYKN